ncbi:hypothetical protein [Enterococcus faecium]|uniref:hypothetical protein n=1 Tax=Enterococcus faecium TaxID=1352 RepID=UPI002B460845|nr:hypothetical protein [Enterococcus faecium]MEB3135369.1 hypothetical protein [Enterococcus faecium]
MNSGSGIRLINFIKRSMMRGSKKTIIKRSTLMPKKVAEFNGNESAVQMILEDLAKDDTK